MQRLVRGLAGSPTALPALAMVAVLVALGAADGGFFSRASLPATLIAVGLLATAFLALGMRVGASRAVRVAASLLAAYAVWSYLSIIWAADPGAALEAANRSLLYAVVFALFALWPMRSGPAATVVGAFGLAVVALGVVTLIRALSAEDVSGLFVYGRFVEPLGYANGNVALWFSGVFPCLFLAVRREVPAAIRGLGLGGAALLVQLAVLGQSRGWLVVLPVALAVFFVVTPCRARHAAAIVAVGVAVLLSLDPILAVFAGASAGMDIAPLLDSAARTILLSAAALAVVGVVAGIVERKTELSPSASRRLNRATAVACALVAVAGAAIALAAVGDPAARASEAWRQLTTVSEPADQPSGSSRFASAGGQNRTDFWRVAIGSFSDSPVLGAGAGNFQAAYLREGRTGERPQDPHSLELRVLSQTGLVGAVLFAGAVIAALLAAARAIRGRSGLAAAAAGTATATFAYWALHASIDWLYALPALAGPAFAMVGLAAALDVRSAPGTDGRPRPTGRDRIGRILVIAAATAAVVALALPYVAQRNVDRAAAIWPDQTDQAFADLRRAASLNPLSAEPHSTAAAIALRLDRLELARSELEVLLEVRPQSAFSTLILGAIASELGRPADAEALLEEAVDLSPNDPLAEEALSEVREGGRLDAEETYDAALERRRNLVDAPGGE